MNRRPAHGTPANAVRLTSLRNPTLQAARRLKNRRIRNDSQRFRIEGYREVERALDAGIELEHAIYCDAISRFERCRQTLKRITAQTNAIVYATTKRVFIGVTQWQNPDGLLVVAKQPSTALDEFRAVSKGVYLIVDGIEKPGNLGSMFRSADATGCNGILISDPTVDLFNPNVVRSSLGTIFTTPCAVATAPEIYAWIRTHDLRIVSTSPSTEQSYLNTALDSDCAIVIGSEKDGLNSSWLARSDELVSLPTEGYSDSLNAAMTATVMLFESFRQRIEKD